MKLVGMKSNGFTLFLINTSPEPFELKIYARIESELTAGPRIIPISAFGCIFDPSFDAISKNNANVPNGY